MSCYVAKRCFYECLELRRSCKDEARKHPPELCERYLYENLACTVSPLLPSNWLDTPGLSVWGHLVSYLHFLLRSLPSSVLYPTSHPSQ